jgi:hypothetical protein
MQPNVMLFALAGIGLNFAINGGSRLAQGLVGRSAPKASSSSSAAAAARVKQQNGPVATAAAESGSSNSGGPDGRVRAVDAVVRVLGFVAAIAVVYLQYQKWLVPSDNHAYQYFHNYASALLKPLPPNALLLINYDQQWTSVRYIQQCEGYRSDVTVINLSMMTYSWFQHKRELYTDVIFPGTYHTYPDSKLIQSDKAFTLEQFLSANVNKRPIFIGGKVNYPDRRLDELFDTVPVGLVSQFVPLARAPNGTAFLRMTDASWAKVHSVLPSLPNETQFPMETWEWTIGRDFKDRVIGKYSSTLFSS